MATGPPIRTSVPAGPGQAPSIPRWVPWALFLGLTVALFRAFIFSDAMLYGSDTLSGGYIARAIYANALAQFGRIPGWQPEFLGGTPFVEALSGADAFYPPSLLLLILLEPPGAWVGNSSFTWRLPASSCSDGFARSAPPGRPRSWPEPATCSLGLRRAGVRGSRRQDVRDGPDSAPVLGDGATLRAARDQVVHGSGPGRRPDHPDATLPDGVLPLRRHRAVRNLRSVQILRGGRTIPAASSNEGASSSSVVVPAPVPDPEPPRGSACSWRQRSRGPSSPAASWLPAVDYVANDSRRTATAGGTRRGGRPGVVELVVAAPGGGLLPS